MAGTVCSAPDRRTAGDRHLDASRCRRWTVVWQTCSVGGVRGRMRGVSYDLAVWEGDRPANDFAARARFKELHEQYMGAGHVAPTERIVAYVMALLERHPDLSADDDEDAEDGSPWSTSPLLSEASGPLVYFPMVWSRAEQASAWAAELAARHGLNCYDPQWNQLRTEPREAWSFELKSERGRPFRDPDADVIRRVLVRLSRNNYYAVLSRADGWYVQVGVGERAGTRAGWYVLERREGSPDRHFRTELTDVQEVIRMFVAFAEDEPSVVARFAWRPVTL
jgi:hypothetical protein